MNKHQPKLHEFLKHQGGPVTSIAPVEIAKFYDRYGDERIIHKTRSGIRVKNTRSTVAIELNRRISEQLAANIKARRAALGLTLEEVCVRAGLATATPKSRMWEIENSQAKYGLRFGTLYAIAIALETTPQELMPTLEAVLAEATVLTVSETMLKVQP